MSPSRHWTTQKPWLRTSPRSMAWLAPCGDMFFYETRGDGTIARLSSEDGFIPDDNQLNQALGDVSRACGSLLGASMG
ncbi:MAG: hypothetical protein K6F50_06220 [Kiritimatiellae bacterium]|nr:hypothetical protein [Kiritimatiellia bacterium]